MRRRYTAAKSDQRCKADIKLRDSSGAQCMRAAKIDGYCKQHELKRHSKYCKVHFIIEGKLEPCDCNLDPLFDPMATLLKR